MLLLTKKQRIKKIIEDNSDITEVALDLLMEGLVVSVSEGRRLFTQLKEDNHGKPE